LAHVLYATKGLPALSHRPLPTSERRTEATWLRPLLRLAHYTSAHAVLVITAVVGGLLAIGLTAASAGVYDAVSEKDGVSGLDRPVLQQAIAWRAPLLDKIITGFTHLGGPVGMTIIAGIATLIMAWRWRSWTPVILMVIAVAGSLSFTTVGKAIVGRARPPLTDAVPPYEYAFSFPSGHALNSTVIAGMVAYLIGRRLRTALGRTTAAVLAAVWFVAMGLSRVFLGHHWLTDVVFAWLLGLAWLALLITSHRIYLAVRRPRSDSSESGAARAS
jgi:membrane-associated phospholipid phosphatase